MNDVGNNKRNQINNIVSVVKLCSLLFSAIAIFKCFFSGNNKALDYKNNMSAIHIISTTILIFSLIYCIWVFLTTNKFRGRYNKRIYFIENIVLILLFFVVVLGTGTYASQYKFLFLFMIIITTIQSGMKYGIIIACLASFIILIMDIVCAPNLVVNEYFEQDLILAGVFILTAWPLGFYVKVENEHIEKLESLVNKDGLTDVYNHRFFHDALSKEVIECEEKNEALSMIFIDIDYFKHYNDLYGHQKGDQVLKTIGEILKNNTRKEDIVARYGGEEFAVLLPNTSEQDAINIAEKIRKKIEYTYFEGEENQPNGNLTVSMGISVYPYKAKSDMELIKSADDALYRAKFFNKNRVEAYTSILDELKNDIDEEHIDLVTSIKTLISVINAKDRYTYGHVERVVLYSRLLADKLKLSEEDKKNFIYGAYMHDIGKINISREILNKKMPLAKEEWEILKQHPVNGVEIIKPVSSLQNISDLILHHHERYDGKGYPDKLKGDNIPFLARALTVVDSFDAMTSNRPYNRRKTYEEAIEELERCSGTQFDSYIAEKFIEVIIENKDSFDDLSLL
ncbi:bifunctional diguanylate cyclase/phosphohydrolase [Clostridium botulinum]|uniref:bifunctional diguanylate cyclase/phosphohydrolase n=1 Tax=Clostridium botulinum TaxID=1491 RepID=UPI00016B95A5|nr:diguanylate cyclase [Clostridium botulinum]APC81499.1 diguanylate cyclase domain protein [Clostridium botulinum]APC85211.1 diguanylate cyclase domain protein [Clostridium botulinum]AXG96305.1 diguanylate cyclase [Clostridium botulinum]EDT82655.1 GGDEF/HD domain protein [Clostridium botulinum NCTC 2916]MBY6772567.1 diguanylate cyclase [Clostridium botulinum]